MTSANEFTKVNKENQSEPHLLSIGDVGLFCGINGCEPGGQLSEPGAPKEKRMMDKGPEITKIYKDDKNSIIKVNR